MHGLPATGTPFNQVIELAGQGKSLWAATDFGLARVDLEEGRIDLFDEGRGLPYSRVFDVAARQGRIVVGTARGLARLDDSLRVDAHRAAVRRGGLRRLSLRRLGLGRHAAGRAPRAPGRRRPPAAARIERREPAGSGLIELALAGRYPRGAHPRPAPLARSPDAAAGRSAPTSPVSSAACVASRPTGRASGSPESGASASLGSAARAAAAAPRGRPPRDRQRPRGGSGASLGRHRRRPRALPARRYSAVKPGRVPRRPRPRTRSGVRPYPRHRRSAGRARARGLGDDCALLTDIGGTLALSTDVSVEGVHFRLDWVTPEEAGWRAAAAALSDLAAEGAEPVGLLSAVTVPEGAAEADLGAMTGGVGARCRGRRRGGAGRRPLEGPGVERHGHGDRPRRASRDACRSPRRETRIWVTGALGGARAALEAWRRGETPTPEARRAYAHPEPQDRGGPLARAPTGPAPCST